MMHHTALKSIPMDRLTSPKGVIVAVWVTNNPSLITYVKNELFPSWNCSYLATWYWIKVPAAVRDGVGQLLTR